MHLFEKILIRVRTGVISTNFRAPDLNWKNFSGGPDIQETYKICSENKRKFKMQQVYQK
jgi:hypothetical protein